MINLIQDVSRNVLPAVFDDTVRYPNSIEVPVHENSVCQQGAYNDVAYYVVDDRVFCEGGVENRSTCRVS